MYVLCGGHFYSGAHMRMLRSLNGAKELAKRAAMNKNVKPFVENIAEATTACLITMVQGNVLALGLSHWLIASQTGVAAGSITAATILLLKTDKRWMISLLLGVITATVDYFMHPGMFGTVATEAIVTGVGAAFLSYAVSTIITRYRGRTSTID